MWDRLFLNDRTLALEPALLFSERAFENGVCRQNLVPKVSILFRRRLNIPHMLTISYFFNSVMLDSREAPCQTRTSIPVECASISFFHCMTATVGLQKLMTLISRAEQVVRPMTYATTRLGLAPLSVHNSAIIWMVLPMLKRKVNLAVRKIRGEKHTPSHPKSQCQYYRNHLCT